MSGYRTVASPAGRRRRVQVVHETPKRLRLRTSALSDPSLDTGFLEGMLEAVPGVVNARVNPAASCVTVRHDGGEAVRARVLAMVEDIPGEAFLPGHGRARPLALPTVVGQGLAAAATPFLPSSVAAPLGLALGLPTIAQGMGTLLSEGVKVEVLDAAAVGASLLRGDTFTASAIVAMLGLGNWLEQWTTQKSDQLLKDLLRPQVESVWVERDAHEERISFADLRIGDVIICGAGELIPVDGVVVDGEAAVNRSSITGESLPVHAELGTEVLSGSLVEDGRLKIAASTVGSETSMARTRRFLQNSLRSKSASQKHSDELADRLVPVTLALGLGLFVLTRDVRRASAVLTVDYSCALKLAAPVAVKSGMHAAGHRGVLLKGGQALDNLAAIDTLVFDKTGTLTRGDLRVTDVLPLDPALTGPELLALAAGAEEHYSHPVARAVVAEAKARGLALPPISQVDFIVAHGVSAFVDGDRVLVGSRHFLEDDEGVDCAAADTPGKLLRGEGKSLLCVARAGRLAGLIALRDEPRPEAAEALQKLRARGITRIVVLTGDHRETALAVLKGFDVDEIRWELKPEDKADIVRELQSQGRKLAFAGDGVNDAPALLTADVGVCMPGGADLARESAQVVLLEDNLLALVTARDIAARTRRVLTNSFRTAVGVNSAVMLLAAAGRLSPVTSAILHNACTLGILGYAALSGGSATGAKAHTGEPQPQA
ncbi:Cu2+-exporting ATPase [Humidesulfovibrio mexicanus]|uniref:P-type Zn(2+) transporter n=1 Tax=Humidesulfovibrio mexicanus TaxID=147047 RepID=A0A239D8Z4_9BACT|nr:heavy metal translocating P-type ATPase [Humidesulfovibrio mexicanus]SNS28311.1 Cu2+-exporting ATPase [Humidesulfovibrio mexicanus]